MLYSPIENATTYIQLFGCHQHGVANVPQRAYLFFVAYLQRKFHSYLQLAPASVLWLLYLWGNRQPVQWLLIILFTGETPQ